jgi:hypothetical protein
MIPLLLALLLQDESLSAEAKRLAKDPKSNREAILKLGPSVLRPLLEVRSAELEPILDELRFAGRGDEAKAAAGKLTAGTSVRVKDIIPSGALSLILTPHNLKVAVDPTLAEKFDATRFDIDMADTTLGAVLRHIAVKTGTEYGWARGRIVFSTPERLWAPPAVRVPPLTADQEKKLRDHADRLGDDSPEVRDVAAAAILALGPAAIPALEKLKGDGGLDQQGRIRDLIVKLTPVPAAPVFRDRMAFESQDLGDADKRTFAPLSSQRFTFKVKDLVLPFAVKLAVSQANLPCDTTKLGAEKTSCSFDNETLGEMLYWILVPYGYDAYIDAGQLMIDTRDNVEHATKKK